MEKVVIGVDLGGTNIRAGIVDRNGSVSSKIEGSTSVQDGKDIVIERLVEELKALQNEARTFSREVSTIGIGAPGIISIEKGIIALSPNLPDWIDVPLRDIVRDGIGIPVVLENDANAWAFGEKWVGAGKEFQDFILITLGTGVGGGIIHGGEILHGADGMAGEIGHMTVNPDGPKCVCGNSGCLEVYASARGIVDRTIEAIESGGETRLKEITEGNFYKISSEIVYQVAKDGDSLARDIMREMGRYLGIGIANLINIFNPEAVIIGGGVKEAWDLFIESAKREIQKRAFSIPVERAKIVQSSLSEGGLIGAAGIAMKVMS